MDKEWETTRKFLFAVKDSFPSSTDPDDLLELLHDSSHIKKKDYKALKKQSQEVKRSLLWDKFWGTAKSPPLLTSEQLLSLFQSSTSEMNKIFYRYMFSLCDKPELKSQSESHDNIVQSEKKHMFVLGPPPSLVFNLSKECQLKEPLEVIKHRDLVIFIGWKELEWVCVAIKEGAPVNTSKEYANKYHIYHSPLHYAILCDYAEIVPVLVEEGHAEVDARAHTYPYFTPLQMAAAKGKAEMVNILLKYGADPSLLIYLDDPGSCIPIYRPDTVEMAKSMNHKEVVHVLEEYLVYQDRKLQLQNCHWRTEPDMPNGITITTAAYYSGKLFVGEQDWPFNTHLSVFDVKFGCWSEIPFYDSREMHRYTLTATTDFLLLIGGEWVKGVKVSFSQEVLSLTEGNVQAPKQLVWKTDFPKLNIGRHAAASTSFNDYVVVAGGWNRDGLMSSVEVLNTAHKRSTWFEISNLPLKSTYMQCVVTQNELIVGFGHDTSNRLFAGNLAGIYKAKENSTGNPTSQSFWKELPKAPLSRSGLVFINGCLLAVGGFDNKYKDTSAIFLYDQITQKWSEISKMNYTRRHPAVVKSCYMHDQKTEMFIIGGYNRAHLKVVESCEL